MIPTSMAYIDNLAPTRGRFPYYIVAPPYIRLSAGIRGLHLVCHWLNMTGQSAFMLIYPPWDGLQVNPELQTPVLTNAIIEQHFAIGATPIVIYPEIIHGNPFEAPVRARWIGNYPGLLGGPASFDPDEILFAQSCHLANSVGGANVLSIPVIDTSLFKPAPVVERSGVCFYAGKFQIIHGRQVFRLPEGSVEITRDSKQFSPAELASLFRRSTLFYCFEDSALINEAALCGCPVVMMKSDFFRWPLAIDEMGWDGYAWGDDPDEVERARRTVAKAYDNYVRAVPKFFTQLHYLVLVTQKRASATPYLNPIVAIDRSSRPLSLKQSWRKVLGHTLLELKTLKSGGPASAGLLWTPSFASNDAQGAVTLVSGWSSPENDILPSHGPVSSLAVVPPGDAQTIEIELSGLSATGHLISIDVLIDGDLFETVRLTRDEIQVIRAVVFEPMRPLIITFAHSDSPAADAPFEGLYERVGLRLIRAVTVLDSHAGVSQPVTPSAAAFKVDLSKSFERPATLTNCTVTADQDGFTINSFAPDPQIVLNLDQRLAVNGRTVHLWGIYDADADDEMQVFLPLPKTGGFSETLAVSSPVRSGINTFVLSLPYVDEIAVLRFDPTHRPGRTRIQMLQLIVAEENASQLKFADDGGLSGGITQIQPNLDRFRRYSLLLDVAAGLTKDCVAQIRDDYLCVTAEGPCPEIVFNLMDQIAPGPGAVLSLSGECECDTDDKFDIGIPNAETGAFNEVATVALQAGLSRFSTVLPVAAPIQLFRVFPIQRSTRARFRQLDLLVERG